MTTTRQPGRFLFVRRHFYSACRSRYCKQITLSARCCRPSRLERDAIPYWHDVKITSCRSGITNSDVYPQKDFTFYMSTVHVKVEIKVKNVTTVDSSVLFEELFNCNRNLIAITRSRYRNSVFRTSRVDCTLLLTSQLTRN